MLLGATRGECTYTVKESGARGEICMYHRTEKKIVFQVSKNVQRNEETIRRLNDKLSDTANDSAVKQTVRFTKGLSEGQTADSNYHQSVFSCTRPKQLHVHSR